MPAVYTTNKSISDAETSVKGLTKSFRKIQAIEALLMSGELNRVLRPILIKFLARCVYENFMAKKDVSGNTFRATKPSNFYRRWAAMMIKTGKKVYVGAGGKLPVKHPATAAWAGRRTDYMWEKEFKNVGKPLVTGARVSFATTKSTIKGKYEMNPVDISDFVGKYPLKFFARGNNPFFITEEQKGRLNQIMINTFKTVRRYGM